jgi:N-acetyl-gamma-glutamyl-phosphate reductase
MHPRVAVIGASGYSGVELTKILDGHPGVELTVAASDRWVGESVAQRAGVRAALKYAALDAAVAQAKQCDVVFLATPADASHELVPQLAPHTRVVDLSGAYRLRDAAKYELHYRFTHAHAGLLREAVYGLPELYREKIVGARLVANPGCYATAIQLALAPLVANSVETVTPSGGRAPASAGRARMPSSGEVSTKPFAKLDNAEDMLDGRIVVTAMSGVTGAGRKASEEYSFSEISDDVRAYRVLKHQHEPEIEQSLSDLGERTIDVSFVPHLLPIRRGILATCHVKYAGQHDVLRLYKFAYSGEPFISIAPAADQVALHDIVGTNKCRIGITAGENGELVIISAIDNLVKGAAGQAVQNMNLMLGLDEQAGLAGLRSFHP